MVLDQNQPSKFSCALDSNSGFANRRKSGLLPMKTGSMRSQIQTKLLTNVSKNVICARSCEHFNLRSLILNIKK